MTTTNRAVLQLLIVAITFLCVGACALIPNTPTLPLAKFNMPRDCSGSDKLNGAGCEIEAEIERLLSELTLDEKISLVHAKGKFSVASVERLGIHETWLSDGPHGVREEISRDSWMPAGWSDDYSTYLPPLTTVAASWNRDIAKLHGDVLGSEARHRGKDFILGPGVNLARLPLNGRNFEYMGEDPVLAGKLAVAEIAGIQANNVAATIKHYALNTQELNRRAVDAQPDERTLREIYLPAFEIAVKEGGVFSVMGAYNQFRGTNTNQSRHLVTNILKGEWGFQGILMTDWNVDINTFDAAMNGLDLEMGTDKEDYQQYFFARPLLEMVKSGKVPEAVLDDKVRRMLRVQLTMGKMNKNRLSGQRNTMAHRQAARTIAREGIVLLKNESVLPFDRSSLKKVLVLGPNADRKHAAGGGSSGVKTLYEITPLDGIKSALGEGVQVTYMRTRTASDHPPIDSIFVETRHWTGTPAWHIRYFADPNRTEFLSSDTTPDSSFLVTDGKSKHVTLSADIRPLVSGEHVFKLSALGKVTLRVDGQTLFSTTSTQARISRHSIKLQQNQRYSVEIDYDGSQGLLLGWDLPGKVFFSEKEVLEAAKNADAVIYVGGLSHGDDREAIDRTSLKLPEEQDSMLAAVVGIKPDTVVVMVAGSALAMPWLEDVRALLWAWYGGMEGGNALADVIFGDVNPSGKLPITLPKKLNDTPAIALNDYNEAENLFPEGVFMGYRWFEEKAIEPSFPFGFGLSYTTFKYSDLRLSTKRLKSGQGLQVSVNITNTGTRAGGEVVQLYVHDDEASVPRPIKELKEFSKVFLKPGQTQKVVFSLNERDLSFWDTANNRWYAEAGDFDILVAAASNDIRLKQRFSYQP
jgi:beta-glucosidase